MFVAWRDRRIHGTTGLNSNRQPLEVLNVFGATFCGDDARALGAIAIPLGAEVRFAWLNGHSAAEFRWNGEWTLLDGDQGAVYLRWDNRTPAAEADVLADPLLVLRTKIYGRQSRWDLATAWQNASRFEFVDRARPPKTLRLKRQPSPRSWELLPGDKVVIHLDRVPALALAASEGLRKNPVLRSALCVAEFHASEPARRAAGGKVSLPFPVSEQGGGELVYEVPVRPEPIECQAARAGFPSLRVGTNDLTLQGKGMVRVTFETAQEDYQPVPAPVITGGPEFSGEPHFEIDAQDADRLWWQIAGDREFRFVPPSFDSVARFSPTVDLAPLEATFLSPGTPYFFRAKVRRGGVWSDWSQPLRFTVKKPVQPQVGGIDQQGQSVRLRWTPGAGEILVFGSDRLDFLPEIFGSIEPLRIENGAILERRPNRNLLATVSSDKGVAVVPARAVYRLVAREHGAISVPSSAVRVPGAKARVLQSRHEKADGALTGKDVAVEMDVPN
jgi:hypothetical protein